MLILFSLIISVGLQVFAAFIAYSCIGHVQPKYKKAWLAIATALTLMLERRISPLWRFISLDNTPPISDTVIGLLISLGMVIGVLGLRNLFEELQAQAETDGLTGLNNRRVIMQKASLELERSRRGDHPLSILMLDIDHFKIINDTYGHISGDTVLAWLGKITKAQCRRVDSLGRIGGEEFLIILPDTKPSGAISVAERIRRIISDTPIKINDQTEVKITVSIGMSSNVRMIREPTLQTLIKQADKALYQAKNQGRNRLVFNGEVYA